MPEVGKSFGKLVFLIFLGFFFGNAVFGDVNITGIENRRLYLNLEPEHLASMFFLVLSFLGLIIALLGEIAERLEE